MTANQLPGQTLQPLPANSSPVGDDKWSLLQKCVELSRLWAVSLGKSGATGDPQDDVFTLYSKLDKNIYNIAN